LAISFIEHGKCIAVFVCFVAFVLYDWVQTRCKAYIVATLWMLVTCSLGNRIMGLS